MTTAKMKNSVDDLKQKVQAARRKISVSLHTGKLSLQSEQPKKNFFR